MPTPLERALQISIDHLLEGVQIIDFDWRYLYLNAAASRHAQRPAAELVGRTLEECDPGIADTELFAVLRRVMTTRRPERFLNELACPGGERAWFELRIEPVPDGLCVMSIDVTERRSAELQLERSQKMAALAQLTAGVAHDFNNLLTAILGYTELVLGSAVLDAPTVADVDEIRRAGERATALTRQLLAFTRKQVPQPQVVDLNTIVTDLEQMLSRIIGDDIRIELNMPADLDRMKADVGQIEQVITNLVVNARDALPQGGRIAIETANVRFEPGGAPGGRAAGRYVRLTVRDNGSGMPPDVRSRAFEPFFTTKAAGKGTGLGLATVQNIVRQSGGWIAIESTPGLGTTVTAHFPAAAEAGAPAAAPARAPVLAGTGTILVLDDDAGVRALMRRVLDACGYTVLEARNVQEAIDLAQGAAGPIDLLVTDIVMPDRHGPNLAQSIVGAHPGIKVLYVSGFTRALEAGGAGLSPRVSFLSKPFTPQALARAVRDCLERA